MSADFYAPTDLAASMSWGANCGPAAIAAACGLELAAVRVAVSKKSGFPGHMGIPDVERALRALGRPIVKSASSPGPMDAWPRESTHIGMVEIQGPWSGDKWESAKRRHLVAARWRVGRRGGLARVGDGPARARVPGRLGSLEFQLARRARGARVSGWNARARDRLRPA